MKNRVFILNKDAEQLYQKQLYPDALKLYLQSIELDPLQTDVYMNITKIYIKQGQMNDALIYFHKTLGLADVAQQTKIRIGLAGVFFVNQYYREAIHVFLPVYEAEKNFQYTSIYLRYLIASEDYEQAKQILHQHIEKEAAYRHQIQKDSLIPDRQKHQFLGQLQQSELLPPKAEVVPEVEKTSPKTSSDATVYDKEPAVSPKDRGVAVGVEPERKETGKPVADQPVEREYKSAVERMGNKKLLIVGGIVLVVIVLVTFIFLVPYFRERTAWQTAVEQNTLEAYENYMADYPDQRTEELDEAVWELIDNYPDEMIVMYSGFRLREQPGIDFDIITQMKQDVAVEIIKKTDRKEEVEMHYYMANAYWYKVDYNGVVGWTYGAGLKAPEDYMEMCQFYFDKFPSGEYIDDVEEKYQRCDCNVFDEARKEMSADAFKDYLDQFPNAIYLGEAQVFSAYLDRTVCFVYSDGDMIPGSRSTYDVMELTITESEVRGSRYGQYIGGFGDGDYGSRWRGSLEGHLKGNRLVLQYTDEGSGSRSSEEFILSVKKGMVVVLERSINMKHMKDEYREIDCDNAQRLW